MLNYFFKMLLSHCTIKDIDVEKETYADRYNWFVAPFKPGKNEDSAFVDMATAIGLVNRLLIYMYLIHYIFVIFNLCL